MSDQIAAVLSCRPLSRRAALLGGAATAAVASTGVASAQTSPRAPMSVPDDRHEWESFKHRFIDPAGRVVDTGNGGCSHTEGQGWGMLFAVAFDDAETFDLLYTWTQRHLSRAYDALHCWRYQPGAPVPVADQNNATDGDVSIATALLRASRRWNRPDYARAATRIARDILAVLVTTAGRRTLLLPGVQGFTSADSVTINPSYYAFPMLAELDGAAPSPLWAKLIEDGHAMIDEARFGQWHLPPDWLKVSRADGSLSPHPHWPARFSWDAIRVPLWLAWGRHGGQSSEAFVAYWKAGRGAPPAWVDLTSNAPAPYGAPPGMQAIGCLAVACCRGAAATGAAGAGVQPGFPSLQIASDYYSAALILLSRLAWRETRVA